MDKQPRPDQHEETKDESDINRAVSPPEVGYATPTHATSDMRSTTGGGSGVSSMSMDAANSGTSREVVSSATPAPLADPMTIIMKALADLQMQVMEQQRETMEKNMQVARAKARAAAAVHEGEQWKLAIQFQFD